MSCRQEHFDRVAGVDPGGREQPVNEMDGGARAISRGHNLTPVEEHEGLAQADTQALYALGQTSEQLRMFIDEQEHHGLATIADEIAHVLGVPLIGDLTGMAMNHEFVPSFSNGLGIRRHSRGATIGQHGPLVDIAGTVEQQLRQMVGHASRRCRKCFYRLDTNAYLLHDYASYWHAVFIREQHFHVLKGVKALWVPGSDPRSDTERLAIEEHRRLCINNLKPDGNEPGCM